jgi:transcriptional regulator with XRE-family HTH domain
VVDHALFQRLSGDLTTEGAGMDMRIDSSKVRAERERRAWSQDHLAEVSGLSLRTVQRVESSGSASFESARALAAVLQLDVAELRPPQGVPHRAAPQRWRYAVSAATLVLAVGLFFIRAANAGEVALDVDVTLNREKVGQQQVVAQEGKSAEIRLEGKLRLFVNPIVTQTGAILLSMRVEEPAGAGWKEVEEPRIMVANGDQGTVKVTSPKGSVIEIAIRPRRL